MKISALIIILGLIGCIGCNSSQVNVSTINLDTVKGYRVVSKVVVETPDGKIKVPAYEIGAYKPDPRKYGFKNYNAVMAGEFLSAAVNKYKNLDIIAIDGLKWQLVNGYWNPFPNPSIPVLEEGEDMGKHIQEYAKWIDEHPHFGYPPLPMMDKE